MSLLFQKIRSMCTSPRTPKTDFSFQLIYFEDVSQVLLANI